jgi:thioredoxin 1
MSDVAEVTDATFEQLVVQSPKPVLVDYWADWCAPCRQLSPIVDELARQYGDKVTFLKLDTNANPDTPVKYGVLGLPTLQVWSGGQLVNSMTGGKSKAALIKALAEYL